MTVRVLALLGLLALAGSAAADGLKDFAPPEALTAGGKAIDVDVGHAAPFVADLHGDGVLHLLVGQFGEGKLRIYPNAGTQSQPRFDKLVWFREGAEGSNVPSG